MILIDLFLVWLWLT